MKLVDLQRALLASLNDAGTPVTADPRGVRVYANNHRGQLLGSLRDTYERVALWMGDEVFETLALAYIDQNPSAAWSLNHYGQSFPAYLAGACPLPDPVAELAWLDHALRQTFYSHDVVPLALREAAVIDWEQANFAFVPSLRFGHVHTNAAAIWSALSAGTHPPTPSLLLAPAAVRVWRSELSPRFVSMPPHETASLDLAMAGGTFGDICALLNTHMPDGDTAATAAQLLREWFEDGLVVSVA
ncbi:DNA-binding domain-containing protein [Luteibacter aegosomatissinici]|uniref:HvfC/BufC N-terminal domain-containing protein n=1 Tax=Luteibacter aegosomatissinici TaxID=2911539 RepID=UPI001FFA07B9|nr:DNA-binding domain-containing protein [Luteibacter aegosomatissinici]UPG96048.1 DNA-binding domain-containing protein [Luteibacter aegosomatissinici]